MSFTKITESDTLDKGVIGLADTPGLSTEAMQRKFDELATDVIIPKFNKLSKELDDMGFAANIKSNDITDIRLDSDGNIQVSMDDGQTFSNTSSSGHVIMNGNFEQFEPRSRMQFSANVEVLDDPVNNSTFISVPSAIKGDKGDTATVSIGDVVSTDVPYVVNVGSRNDAVLNFGFPIGEPGRAATIQIGTVTTGGPEEASVSNRGTSANAILDFILPRGERGFDGTSFKILGIYATLVDLQREHPTGARGDAYAVGTSEANTIYNWDSTNNIWVDLGPLRGAEGEPGKAASVTVGTVVARKDGNATVENVGTSTNAVFNFGLPKGDRGDTGAAATVAVGTVTAGRQDQASVVNRGTASNAIFDFVLPKGDNGDPGTPKTINGYTADNIVLGSSDIYMKNYSKATNEASIVDATDSVGVALGKLEYKVDYLSEHPSDTVVFLTEAEYWALPDEVKNNGTTYMTPE